jgi:hypothetical protein
VIEKYRKRSNIAASLWLVSIPILMASAIPGQEGLGWVLWFSAASFFSACAFYLMSKGRSLWWLLLLPPFSLLALITYWRFEDHSNWGSEIKCSSCGGANFSAQENCRYCKAPIHQVQGESTQVASN